MGETQSDEGEGRWDKQVRSETLGHGVRVRPVPKRNPGKVQETQREPAVFARNLRNLLLQAKLSDPEAPAKIGVGRRWLRRASVCGLARIDKRTRADLERVAHYFGLDGPEELWEADPPRLRRQPAIDRQALGWRDKVNWPYAMKLMELLEAGEHDFLKGLIDSLHASELRKVGGGAGAKTVAAVDEEGDASGLKRRLGRKGSIG